MRFTSGPRHIYNRRDEPISGLFIGRLTTLIVMCNLLMVPKWFILVSYMYLIDNLDKLCFITGFQLNIMLPYVFNANGN